LAPDRVRRRKTDTGARSVLQHGCSGCPQRHGFSPRQSHHCRPCLKGGASFSSAPALKSARERQIAARIAPGDVCEPQALQARNGLTPFSMHRRNPALKRYELGNCRRFRLMDMCTLKSALPTRSVYGPSRDSRQAPKKNSRASDSSAPVNVFGYFCWMIR
jgi:hypothetical protein